MAFLRCFGYNLRQAGVADVRVYVEGDNDDELKKYTSDELKKFTMNFSNTNLIASGGFSRVYLAKFPDSTLRAVKIMDRSSERLNRIYKQELDILLQIQNDNIIKLLDHCEDEEFGNMLVFEYVPNGTLQDKLHGNRGIIPWRNRMAAALQLAQAIEYLHEKCPLQIVHGDIKSSNILLDTQLNCKLCDFGSGKMGFSSSILPPTNRVMMLGSPGYADPHYLTTGIASTKNDIYSFGIIILELISGVEAFSSDSGERLISKAAPILKNVSKVAGMVDPRLDRNYDLEEAKAMVTLAASCLSDFPGLRPSASEILETMRSRISSITFLFSVDKKV